MTVADPLLRHLEKKLRPAMKKSFFQFFSPRDSESCDYVSDDEPRPAKTTQITVSMPVAESDWLRGYASRTHQHQTAVLAAAFRHALHQRYVERPSYVEPGTSFTRRGVVELDLTLPDAEARWLLQRSTVDQVSPSAVFGEVLRGYKETAPPPDPREVGWPIEIRGQTLFYMQIANVCEGVSSGKYSPDQADEELVHAMAARLYGLLPDIDRREVLRAATAAVRELCINHPGLRRAHGRDV